MSPIMRKLLVVVIFTAVLGVGATEKVVPSEAATTTELMCALSPALPLGEAPWSSTRERPGQPY